MKEILKVFAMKSNSVYNEVDVKNSLRVSDAHLDHFKRVRKTWVHKTIENSFNAKRLRSQHGRYGMIQQGSRAFNRRRGIYQHR